MFDSPLTVGSFPVAARTHGIKRGGGAGVWRCSVREEDVWRRLRGAGAYYIRLNHFGSFGVMYATYNESIHFLSGLDRFKSSRRLLDELISRLGHNALPCHGNVPGWFSS